MKISLVLILALMLAGRADASGSDAAQVLSLVNQARATAGLAPLAANAALTAAAQGHADDMARNGVGIGHIGSDGTTPTSRIVRAGYPAYSWGPFVGENWAAYQTIQASMTAWMSDQPHRVNILNTGYREIGVGVAQTPTGLPILVTDFGAEPNVLPVFANGAGPVVALTLSNENAAPLGDGPRVIGQAVSVDISGDVAFSQVRSFPYATSLQYSAPDGTPLSELYVRFHDALGRTAVSSVAVPGLVVSSASANDATLTPTSTRTIAPTQRPSPTATRRPRSPTAKAVPGTSTKVPPTDAPTNTEEPSATTTAVKVVAIRRPVATPEVVAASSPADTPVITPEAISLFAASGLILLLAIMTFIRRSKA